MIYHLSLIFIYIVAGVTIGGMAISSVVAALYMISLIMADRKPMHYVHESPLSGKGYIIARKKKGK